MPPLPGALFWESPDLRFFSYYWILCMVLWRDELSASRVYRLLKYYATCYVSEELASVRLVMAALSSAVAWVSFSKDYSIPTRLFDLYPTGCNVCWRSSISDWY